jgi:hypothetical protein
MGERVWRRWSEWGWGLELVGGMAQVTVVGYDPFFARITWTGRSVQKEL